MVNHAIIEAIGLKLFSLEKEVIHEKDNDKNRLMHGQIQALWWISHLLNISGEVSDVRQMQTDLSNKSWRAAKACESED